MDENEQRLAKSKELLDKAAKQKMIRENLAESKKQTKVVAEYTGAPPSTSPAAETEEQVTVQMPDSAMGKGGKRKMGRKAAETYVKKYGGNII